MGSESKSPKKKKSKDESKKKRKDEKKEKKSSGRSKSASRDEERRLRRERRKQEKEKKHSSDSATEATPPTKSEPSAQPPTNNYASIFNVTNLAQSAILTEDFKHRISELQFKINSQLIPQRQLILNQIHRVHSKVNEITNIKEGIVNETRDYLQNLISRVNTLEATKQSALKSDLYQLQGQLDEIQGFVQRVSNTLAAQCVLIPDQQVRFVSNGSENAMSSFVELLTECDYLSSRPFKTSIEIDANDMRREVWDMVQHERRGEEMQRVIDAKNAQIERLIKERDEIRRLKDVEIEQLSQLYVSTKMELFQWVKMKGGDHGATIVAEREDVAG